MEYVLLIVLIVVFIIFLNTLSSKIDKLKIDLFEAHRKLDYHTRLLEKFQKPAEPAKEPALVPKSAPEIPKPLSDWPAEKPKEESPTPIPPAPKPQEQPVPETTLRAAAMQQPRPVEPSATRTNVVLPEQKSWWEKFKEQNPDMEKFIGENLINKIGILILVLGISYFVKFAIDKEWIGEPARVGIGILAGGIVMLVAHRLRKNYKAFSSVLVAGAVSIFYFTIAVAFHDYQLFSQTVAFIIMVAITAFSAFLSVSYDRQELAALTLIGGFAVPFMVSTGSNNYIVLFSYITILNVGILAIAYHKKWGLINLQAYVFTVLLFASWLFTIIGTENAPYEGALAFAFTFYFVFLLMNIINNVRRKTPFSNMELSILVSNTFLFYAAGMVLLENYTPEYKGMFTLLLGVFNFCFSWLLYKKLHVDQRAIYILIGLTLTFVTLAIPIQFEGNYITLFWAAEAVLLLWLAQKSKIESFRFGSAIVHALMLISLVMDWMNLYYYGESLRIIINPAFLTSLFAIASCFGVILLLRKDSGIYKLYGLSFNVANYQRIVGIFTLLLVYTAGFLELNFQADYILESTYAAYSLLVFYHMAFCIAFIHLHCVGKDALHRKLGTLIGIANTVAFILLFSNLAYYEVEDYLGMGVSWPLAYWLHFVLLALALYTILLVYRMNKESILNRMRNEKALPWITVFLLVYLASSELMLNWLMIALEPVTTVVEAIGNSVTTNDAYEQIDRVRDHVVKTGYPVLWGAIAFLLLLMGIRKQLRSIRIAALVLLGLTITKLFIYDIRNVSETGKIIAFILLGILILVISFLYQKVKRLVIEDKPENEADDKQTD
ncbi:DUF2339 domain-containing protein [Flavobacterium sp. MFBS3-15]|uniref:DUF2339 domain-containing protein n=1 Tax=Flavobacterium sp. MFBS3-15 TaxID=2989816 RepID=UPI0022356B99|nr:DUF2339 domain-containing protein [Flavobacterium sp. MFBS3-15]MCW4469078.1 DUF2339 domain-containing protein [Flavobacterium sp. MFBS3-15]